MTGERILVVEDERAVARGLEYALQADGYRVLMAPTAAAALDLARTADPHLALLDVRLPDGSGFDVCRTLRAEGRRLPILMLTARDEEVDKVVGLELGADDYIVKPYALRELLSRIRAHLRRAYGTLAAASGGAIGEAVVGFGDVEVDLDRLRVRRGGAPVDLTPTEFRLLRHLVLHPGRPFNRDQLLEAVWGYDSSVTSERTVDVHMRHLRLKLEPDAAAPRWLVTVRGTGYAFDAEGTGG